MNGRGFLTGIIIGGITGGVIALLYAPYTGKKLRKVLGKKRDLFMDEVKDYVETAEDAIKESKKRVESILNDARKMVAI